MKPDLYLVHGWGFSSAVFAPLIKNIETCFRPVALDLPGYGASRDLHVHSLQGLLDYLVGRSRPGCWWLGWSFGASLAMRLALSGHAAGVMAIGYTPSFMQRAGWDHGASKETIATFGKGLRAAPERLIRRFAGMVLHPERSTRLREDFLQIISRDGIAETGALTRDLDLLEHWDQRKELSQLDRPVHLLHGDQDAVTPVDAALAGGKLLPAASTTIVQGIGHCPFYINAGSTAEWVIGKVREGSVA